jgi:hypothetical protein
MSNLVKHGAYEPEAAQQEEEELAKSGGTDFLKLVVGANVVRFLPPPIGRNSPFVMVHQHFVQLPGMSNPASFACPRLMASRPCPVCQKIDQLRGTGNPADYDLAGEFLARLRVFANVIDRRNEEMGPRVLAFGKTIHQQLVKLRKDEDAGGDYTNPDTGFDINIERAGTGKNDTEYFVRPSRKTSKLASDPAVAGEWIEMQADLQKYAFVPSWDDIVKKIGGGRGATAGASARGQNVSGKGGGKSRSTAEDDAFAAPDEKFSR